MPCASRLVDAMNVLTYGYHGGWESVTGLNAPLFTSAEDEQHGNSDKSVDATVRYYIEQGAPPSKLMTTVPFFGVSFLLREIGCRGLHAPAGGMMPSCAVTRERGVCGFGEARYIRLHGLAGAVAYSIDLDDFHGFCSQRTRSNTFTLLTELWYQLNRPVISTTADVSAVPNPR
ncbi:chitotriosidase-1-like [Pollicipes pollicipes]|uniref:chitotriosidase-1-like n=1 Tax=Pollicipes pollicipes TaxID=41117 RepID=UPI0018855C7F|nr:chitotriosidase-1-like [Pollicipes pollicipes]